MPPSSVITHIVLGQPETGSPKISARININKTPIKENRQHKSPINDAIDSGTVENATIPSKE